MFFVTLLSVEMKFEYIQGKIVHVRQKIIDTKINRNVDELMMITKKFINFNVVLFTITTTFDKCDLYSIRASEY